MKPPSETSKIMKDKETGELMLYPQILMEGEKHIQTKENKFGESYLIFLDNPTTETQDKRESMINIYHNFPGKKSHKMVGVICLGKKHHRDKKYHLNIKPSPTKLGCEKCKKYFGEVDHLEIDIIEGGLTELNIDSVFESVKQKLTEKHFFDEFSI